MVATKTAPAKVAAKPVAKPVPEVEQIDLSCIEGLTAEIVAITLVRANTFLLCNRTNRPLKEKRVARYCTQMLDGIWAPHLPFTIVLDNEPSPGNHNSQHTLTAFIRAHKIVAEARGTAFNPQNPDETGPEAYPNFAPVLAACVISGIDEADADFLDIGDSRVAGDVLFRKHLFEAGYKGPAGEAMHWKDGPKRVLAKWLGTALKIVYNRLYLHVKVRNAQKFEQGSMLATLANHERIIESCVEVWCANQLSASKGKAKDGIASKISPPYAVALHYLAWHSELDENGVGTRREAANAFIRSLAVPTSTGKDDPCFALREYLIAEKTNPEKGNVGLDRTYDACIVAWNAFASGKKLTSKKGATYLLAVDQGKDENGNWTNYPEMGGLDSYTVSDENTTVE